MSLASLRRRIDAIDARLLRLLNARSRTARSVAEHKALKGLPVLDAARERAVLERLARLSRGPLDSAALDRIFRALMTESRRIQAEVLARARSEARARRGRGSVAIVGLGLIGGSLAKALRRSGRWRVLGVPGPGVRASPALRAEVDAVIPASAALDADVVVLAAPLGQIVRLLRRWGPRARPGTLWTDVGSAKGEVCRAARRFLARGAFFVGGHPMAGGSRGGFGNSRADLFDRATWALTPVPGRSRPKDLALARALARDAGARPLAMSAGAHDRAVAFTSHLPQFAASAVAATAGPTLRRALGLSLAGRGLRDTTRLAESPTGIWKDIAAQNRGNIKEAMEEMMKTLNGAKTLTASGVGGLFRRAHEARRRLYRG